MGTRIETFPPNVRDRILKAMKATAPEPRHAEEAAELADEIEGEKQEKELQRLCEQELSRRGIPYLHLSHRAREKKGWPDLVFPLHGQFYAVELKTQRGRLSSDQRQLLTDLDVCGAHVFVCRSYDEFFAVVQGPEAYRYQGEGI